MSRADLFPDAHSEGRDDRVAACWDLDWPLPIPRAPLLLCPCCSVGNPFPTPTLVLKDWKFHSRSDVGSKQPWRCDVRLKCVGCSAVLTYGVAVPRQTYDKARAAMPPGRLSSWLHWREGKQLLAEAGFFEEG